MNQDKGLFYSTPFVLNPHIISNLIILDVKKYQQGKRHKYKIVVARGQTICCNVHGCLRPWVTLTFRVLTHITLNMNVIFNIAY